MDPFKNLQLVNEKVCNYNYNPSCEEARENMRAVVFIFLLTCIFLSCMSEQTSSIDKAQPKQQSKAVKAALKKVKANANVTKNESKIHVNKEKIASYSFNLYEALMNLLSFCGCIAVSLLLVQKCYAVYEDHYTPSSSTFFVQHSSRHCCSLHHLPF